MTEHLAGRRAAVVNWRDPEHHLAGGSESYAWQAAIALRDAGMSVEFLTSRDTGQPRSSSVDRITVRRAGGRFSVYLWTWWLLITRRRRLDVVLDVENGIPSFSPLVLRRRCVIILVMHHVHLDQFGSHFPKPLAVVGRVLERRAMPAVYRRRPVIAVSDSTRDQMRERLAWKGDIDVVHNGCDMTFASARSVNERLAVLGRLVAHKRVDLVIRAVAELRAAGREVPLDIIGRGPQEHSLRQLAASLGVEDLVTLHGFVSEDEKARVLSAARLHVCASEGEGWGQVVLEAAAVGVPTVAFDVAGLRDSILAGRTGWLIPSARPLAAAIADALDLLADPARAVEIAEACQAWAGSFTWPTMRDGIMRVVGGAVQA